MSWINDLMSAVGAPAGAVTISAAMYSACLAAEKSARPKALVEIGRILKDPSWALSLRPSAIISRLFNWTFGESHLSLKCVTRSMCATSMFVVAIIVSLYLINDRNPFTESSLRTWYYDLPLLGFVPDYVAPGKTRMLLRLKLSAPLLIILDVTLSLIIASICFIITDYIFLLRVYDSADMNTIIAAWKSNLLWMLKPNHIYYSVPAIFIYSTLLTSIWTILMVVSTAAIKLVVPI